MGEMKSLVRKGRQRANGIAGAGSGENLGSGFGPSEAGRCEQHLAPSTGPHTTRHDPILTTRQVLTLGGHTAQGGRKSCYTKKLLHDEKASLSHPLLRTRLLRTRCTQHQNKPHKHMSVQDFRTRRTLGLDPYRRRVSAAGPPLFRARAITHSNHASPCAPSTLRGCSCALAGLFANEARPSAASRRKPC